MNRKRRRGERPLQREEWERRVFGAPGEGDEGDLFRKPKAEPALRELFDERSFQGLPEWSAQSTGDPEELFDQVPEAQRQMVQWLDEGTGVDRTLGASVVRKDRDPNAEMDLDARGPVMVIGSPKDEEVAREKVRHRYGGDWKEGAVDLVRATVAVDKYSDLHNVVSALQASGMELACRPRNRFLEPTDVGYRDVVLNVRLPNGHVGEIQLHLKDILKAKEEAHADYQRIRNAQGDEEKDRTEVKKVIQDCLDRMLARYNTAWADAEAWEEAEAWEGAAEMHEKGQVEAQAQAQGGSKAAAAQDVEYYEMDGLPVMWGGTRLPEFHGSGEPQPVDDLAHFVERRKTISKDVFEQMVQARKKAYVKTKGQKKATGSLVEMLRRRAAENPEFRRSLLDELRRNQKGS